MMNPTANTLTQAATRILYIEDNKTNIRLVERSLKFMGYDLIIAEDGGEGLIKANQELPDIVLLDIDLPTIDGITVLRSLKSNFATKDIPVIMYSTQMDIQTQEICKEYGADVFLHKPASTANLLSVVLMLTPQPQTS